MYIYIYMYVFACVWCVCSCACLHLCVRIHVDGQGWLQVFFSQSVTTLFIKTVVSLAL